MRYEFAKYGAPKALPPVYADVVAAEQTAQNWLAKAHAAAAARAQKNGKVH